MSEALLTDFLAPPTVALGLFFPSVDPDMLLRRIGRSGLSVVGLRRTKPEEALLSPPPPRDGAGGLGLTNPAGRRLGVPPPTGGGRAPTGGGRAAVLGPA